MALKALKEQEVSIKDSFVKSCQKQGNLDKAVKLTFQEKLALNKAKKERKAKKTKKEAEEPNESSEEE